MVAGQHLGTIVSVSLGRVEFCTFSLESRIADWPEVKVSLKLVS